MSVERLEFARRVLAALQQGNADLALDLLLEEVYPLDEPSPSDWDRYLALVRAGIPNIRAARESSNGHLIPLDFRQHANWEPRVAAQYDDARRERLEKRRQAWAA